MDGFPPIQIPGMQAEKDSSDSDPEAVAARKQRKTHAFERQQAEERREEEAKKERRKQQEATADIPQILHHLCPDESEVTEFLSSIDSNRPEELEDRLQAAVTLREKAKVLFDESQLEEAIRHWLGAVHCIDFTPRQMAAQSLKDRQRIKEGLLPLLSNLSLANRKLGKTREAFRCADIGLEVVQQTPYESSKPLRVKLRLRRALARGELRNFEGARSDAQHVLDLSPGHEEATCIVRNCEIAMKREKGPKDRRWNGSLATPLPRRKVVQKDANSHSKMALMAMSILVPVLLAYYVWSVNAAPAALVP